MKKLLFLLGLGALARRLLLDRQRRDAIVGRAADIVASARGGYGPLEPQPEIDDVTVARKVESELFRGEEVEKGKVNVNVEFGKVVLRGEVDSRELIDDLVARARGVEGVNDVESLLHTPGEAAPAHQ